jgi:hypothetical protein
MARGSGKSGQTNRISGKVLAQGSLAPVGDVLVVAYDFDGTAQEMPPSDYWLSRPGTGRGLEGASAGVDFTGVLLEPSVVWWDSMQSNRLGSKLTDENGRFELEFSDDLFNDAPPDEGRPDFLLMVMAPEDTPSNSPVVSVAAKRVLHVSNRIRKGAGRSEEYIIRVPPERLDAFQIPHGARTVPSEPYDVEPAQLVAALDRRLRLNSALNSNATLRELLAAPRTDVTEKMTRGRDIIARLGDGPAANRGGLRVMRSSERLPLQRQAITESLGRLGRPNSIIRVPVDETTADAVEETLAAGTGTETSPVPDLLNGRRDQLDRVRARSLLEACLARRHCHEMTNHEPGANGHGSPGTGLEPAGGNGATVTTEEATARVLARVVKELDSPRLSDLITVRERADSTGLQASLDSVKLKGGPADVTSFHDFHTLQIAFKSVWERVYDAGLGVDGGDLYEQWVQVRHYLGLDEPSPEMLAEFRSLRDLIVAVEGDLSAAAGLSARVGTLPDWGGSPSLPGPAPYPNEAVRETVSAVRGDGRRPRGARRAGDAVVVTPPSGGRPSVVVTPASTPLGTGQLPGAVMNDNLLLRVKRLTEGLAGRLTEPYAFDVFAPDTFNFGVMVTYRQRWDPEAYQVGELVSTVPLAPGEKRSFSAKQTVRKSRSEKEVENALNSQRHESSQTARADAEIVRKASSSTNFKQTAQGSFSLGGFMQLGSTTEFGTQQGQESQQRKQDFRESVRRAAEEYKSERTLEVSTSEERDDEITTSGEITNPNNEITVTYLFYELQRRYRVSEQLHRVRPVLLVAQDVPSPKEIDEDWLLAHEWILRRVLLDDALKGALDHLTESLVGDEFAVEVLRATWQRNLQVVDRIAAQLDAKSALRDQVRTQVVKLLQGVQEDNTGRDVAAAIFSGGLSLLFGGGGGGPSLEATRDAANRELEFTDAEHGEIEGRLRQAVSALETSTDKYVAALRSQLNRRVALDQLRVHVKENILHYMQAIWNHEPSDQRFFRLSNLRVPWVQLSREAASSARVVREPIAVPTEPRDSAGLMKILFPVRSPRCRVEVPAGLDVAPETAWRPLVEVADLDAPLGFKGNYMILPLKESNPLTAFMMQEYEHDDLLGVLDPDDSGNVTSEELEEVLECVEHDAELSANEREAIRTMVCQRMLAARGKAETIIVPTGQLYIEALPGTHPVLEAFKLVHRAIDVKKADAEVRALEMGNLRYAARLIRNEHGDPNVEKVVRIEGGSGVDIET